MADNRGTVRRHRSGRGAEGVGTLTQHTAGERSAIGRHASLLVVMFCSFIASVWLAEPAAAEECYPGATLVQVSCPEDIMWRPLKIWLTCSADVEVDINMRSFDQDPLGLSACWIQAIQANAIAGWNHAYSSIFGHNLFKEVGALSNGSRAVQFSMVNLGKY